LIFNLLSFFKISCHERHTCKSTKRKKDQEIKRKLNREKKWKRELEGHRKACIPTDSQTDRDRKTEKERERDKDGR